MTAVRTRPEVGVDSARLRLNRVLNLSGRTGRSAGNALGVLGLFFASLESGLDYLNDARLPEVAPSLGAGAQASNLGENPMNLTVSSGTDNKLRQHAGDAAFAYSMSF